MEIAEFTADDLDTVTEVVELLNAAILVDAPWEHPETVKTLRAMMQHGWDGETPRSYVLRDGGRVVAASELSTSEWDNTHLAWLSLSVHPDERRSGYGSELLQFTISEAKKLGRTSVGIDGWDLPATHGFAAKHGLERKSAAINRRQYVEDVDAAEVEKMYVDAREAASSYELLRIVGRTPDDMLDAVAEMSTAINDAPTDDLDIDDEAFPKERIEAYEAATLAREQRMYRLVARHRESGELAGHTIVAVETDRPQIGHQHDTSVVRSHRGHRLGLLLKSGMIRWLAEVEPQLSTVDTWNAESNAHMVAVNETLGYRVLGRGFQFQRDI